MAPLQKVDFAEDDPEARGEKRTRSKRKRKKKKAEVPDWDAASGKWRMNSAGRKRTLQTIAIWVGSLAVLVAAIYLFKKAGAPDRTRRAKTSELIPQHSDNPVIVPLVSPGGDAAEQLEMPADEK